MVKYFLTVLVLCFLLFSNLTGQPLDSVINNQSPTPFFTLDSRNSNINATPIRMFGIKIGLEWADKYRAGFGHYRLFSDPKETVRYGPTNSAIRSRLRFRYFTLFGEYRFLKTKKWTATGTFHFGLGQAFYEPLNKKNLSGRIKKETVLLIGPYLSGSYRIIPWLGVGGGLGYRKTLVPDLLSTKGLNGGIVSIGIQVYPFALYEAIFKKQ